MRSLKMIVQFKGSMIPKIISRKQHGIADWAFVAGLLTIPRLLGVNRKAQKIYIAFAADVVER
jgi:hypothetical protein